MPEAAVRTLFTQTFVAPPAGAVAVGDKWTRTDKIPLTGLGDLTNKTKYTLDGVKGDIATVKTPADMAAIGQKIFFSKGQCALCHSIGPSESARCPDLKGIGAKLSPETKVQNYGHLHVVFDDGSVGWYEAGWGPMMSEVAYFVKDVVGPKGCVSIVVPQEGEKEAKAEGVSDSADIDQHTKTNALKIHHADIDARNNFTRRDEWINLADEPDHQELCNREQRFLLKAIRKNLDLTDQMDDAVNSLRIVLAADESIRTKRAVNLKSAKPKRAPRATAASRRKTAGGRAAAARAR